MNKWIPILLLSCLTSFADINAWNGVTASSATTFNGVTNFASKIGVAVKAASGGGGGGTCPADGSPSLQNDGTNGITFGGGNLYGGQASWGDGGTPRTICKVGFKLTGATGASTKTFQAQIFSMDVTTNYNLGTLRATSDGVTGVDAWSETWVYFTFPTPFLTTANAKYGIVVSPDVAFGGNDMILHFEGNTIEGNREVFSSLGYASFASGEDAAIKIFWLTP